MAKIRKQNVFNTLFAAVKFVLFWLAVFIQLPIILLIPKGRISVWYMRVFMNFAAFFTGVKVELRGKLSEQRPLLVVSNHISVFELAIFPIAFMTSFFGKKDIESYPLVGWVSKKFGVIFVDRRPSKAMEVLNLVQNQMASVDYPMVLFPEGTTTNGAYVKQFKSSLFNFVEGSDVTIQPVVMHYRHRDGTPLSDEDLAEHFAYFNNRDQDTGPKCSRERSAFGQVFHVMVLGGFKVEITVLEPVPLAGMSRKEIASKLHKIVSDKYMELKDKR